ncbi:class II aldolase/adducin family protein, partial [Bacillus spizizenii]|uniref:class II aldolase/adducin family protein n=1 Tax=Bacillus spizizenii TaxID=96241 RepID=UPI001F60A80F
YYEEIIHDYYLNTGKVIAETFQHHNYEQVPCVLVNNHGPFCWGTDALNAIHTAVVLETVAEMAYLYIMLNKDVNPIITVLH